jgi:hypothetical protein
MHQPESTHGSHCAIRWLAHFARPGVRHSAEGPSATTPNSGAAAISALPNE